MTPKERSRAFDKVQREILRAKVSLINDTTGTIRAILQAGLAKVRATLAGQPTDYQQWQLPQVEMEIERTLVGSRNQAVDAAGRGLNAAWQFGIDAIDRPLRAAEFFGINAAPQISSRQLSAISTFMTDRLRDVTYDAVNKINTDLGLVMIGAQSPSEAVTRITATLEGATRDRAVAIVRTELGRAYQVASQSRAVAANKVVPMDKVWRRSGKIHQRPNHALADGQRVPVDEPFKIPDKDGVIFSIMHPLDPAAPVGEIVNCGCTAIPKPRGWANTTPDRVPFRADELSQNTQLAALVIDRGPRPKRTAA